jgi:putative AlgH/UPF0301 family transcriptional regulator
MIMLKTNVCFSWFASLLSVSLLLPPSFAYQICPGTGLLSQDNVQIVIFEHTEMGTGGLILNCPTPLSMGHLPIPRFRPFKELPLMLGCGMEEDDAYSTVSLGEVSPWFWLHDLDNIPGSFELQGAARPLYMGGDIEEATKRLEDEKINPLGRFKFFRKYKCWQAGELEAEVERGEWETMEQDPEKALEAVMIPTYRLRQ